MYNTYFVEQPGPNDQIQGIANGCCYDIMYDIMSKEIVSLKLQFINIYWRIPKRGHYSIKSWGELPYGVMLSCCSNIMSKKVPNKSVCL